MLTSLLRCRACRLSWFPKGGAAAACPACGGANVGGTLEPFHIGMALIALAVIGWTAPLILGDRVAATLPAIAHVLQPGADAKPAPSRGTEAHVSSTKVKSTKVESKKRQKAKKRSKHVQR